MDMIKATNSFAALSQETRLKIFKLLIEYGRTGLPAGQLSERLDIPHNTLSFHLSHLNNAGLVTSHRDGRQIIYAANCEVITALIVYLKENCCILEDPSADKILCRPSVKVKDKRNHEEQK